MTRCTVCDGLVQPAEQIETEYETVRYEFCSDECKLVFRSAPANYANQTNRESEHPDAGGTV